MHRPVDAHSPIPIRRQLTEPRKHVIEGGSAPRNQALPSIRALAGFSASIRIRRARHRGSQAEWVPAASPLTAAPSSIPRVPPAPGATRETLRGEKGFRQRVGKGPAG